MAVAEAQARALVDLIASFVTAPGQPARQVLLAVDGGQQAALHLSRKAQPQPVPIRARRRRSLRHYAPPVARADPDSSSSRTAVSA